MNYVSISGRLVKDVELKYTTSNIPVCNFTVAVNKNFKNADGNYEANFINCVAWRKTAELIAKYLKKGSLALYQGELSQNTYEYEGRTNYKLEVLVSNVEFLETKAQAENNQAQAQEEQTQDTRQEPFSEPPQQDEELPF